MRTWCLDFHAHYRCRHSGACCGAPWDIEVEPVVVAAVNSGRIVALHPGVNPFTTDGGGSVTLSRSSSGDCHFHHDSRCGLQIAGGEPMLPSACRHFPRVLLLDGRGCLLTLSHYCPTAAALLVDGDGDLAVVEAPAPLALTPPLEGLDARDVLPPLLRPGMLMDLDSYARFETACLTVLEETSNIEAALSTIAAAVESIRRWRPQDGALVRRVDEAFAAADASAPLSLSAGFAIARTLTGPHPWMEMPDDFDRLWTDVSLGAGSSLQRLLRRYLAAATFGNWMCYRSEGLRSVVEWLRACFDIVRLQIVREARSGGLTRSTLIEAVRAADYLAVHTVDSLAFGRAAVACENASYV